MKHTQCSNPALLSALVNEMEWNGRETDMQVAALLLLLPCPPMPSTICPTPHHGQRTVGDGRGPQTEKRRAGQTSCRETIATCQTESSASQGLAAGRRVTRQTESSASQGVAAGRRVVCKHVAVNTPVRMPVHRDLVDFLPAPLCTGGCGG